MSTSIEISRLFGDFRKCMQFEKFQSILIRDINIANEDIHVHKFATYGNIQYREGAILIENERISEIANILSIDSKVYFICQQFKIIGYIDFCNSIEIEKENHSITVMPFQTLSSKFVYDKMYAENKYFIIADKLHIAELIS